MNIEHDGRDVALDTVTCSDALAYLRTLPDEMVHCVITSPPYFGLRDYGHGGQWGLEATPQEHVARMVALFREVRRVLRDDGVLWVNYGDSYAAAGYSNHDGTNGAQREDGGKQAHSYGTGLAAKQLIGMPWRVAFGLQDDGWILRSDVIWAKPNPMPESVTDRPTKAHEYVFLFSKSGRYWWDQEAVREAGSDNKPWAASSNGGIKQHLLGHNNGGKLGVAAEIYGRNLRSVWTIATEPTPFAHFATFPQKLVERCLLAGCPSRVCAVCGAPWVREVKREKPPETVFTQRNAPTDELIFSGTRVNGTMRGQGQKLQNWLDAHPRQTLGFHPTCDHDATSHGIVLDPFMGSGTTALVARRLGRHYVGCDLSPEYVELARKRLAEPYTLPLELGI